MESSINKGIRLSLRIWLLSCLFGIGSWVVMNGLYVELPNLVNHAPEGWKLPAFMTVIVQLANIGPIVYTIIRQYCVKVRKDRLEHFAICLILVLGIVGSVLLACYWRSTSIIVGEEHSTAFLLLTFTIALVDCTSSVTFLPFMSTLPAFYMSPFYVGENMSSLVASLFGLAQGVERYSTSNSTAGEHSLVVVEHARFSQNVFFFILGTLMAVCLVSYLLLSRLPSIKKLYAGIDGAVPSYKRFESSNTSTSDSEFYDDSTKADPDFLHFGKSKDYVLIRSCFGSMLCLNVFQNGVMSSIGSYIYAPYGELAYHFASTLGPIVASISCFTFMFFPRKSLRSVIVGTVGYLVTVVYLIAMATMSPKPLLHNNTFGKFLIVVVGALSSSLVSYTKLAIASIMRDRGHQYLFYTGVTMQLGSFIGAVVTFPIVNYTNVFES